ncbi:MAG: Asd/ArgC dimerization domain-containing protein, partial [Dehalococcoidia bacterium]|nr:Asd/ArgC dimerization domain-containing protein [Dehalococcoidia bacterium]
VEETRKILHAHEIAISATCVRVPVFVGHSEAMSVEFSHPITPEEAWEVLRHAPGVRLQDEPEISLYPTAWTAAGGNDVVVGRIRQDTALPNGLSMWVVADNLRKGAALNAVQIGEILVERGLYERAG